LKKVIGAACAGWWDANVVVDRKVARHSGLPRENPIFASSEGLAFLFAHPKLDRSPARVQGLPWLAL